EKATDVITSCQGPMTSNSGFPSRVKSTGFGLTEFNCSAMVRSTCPLAASHSLSVLLPPASTCRPSGENATDLTSSDLPFRVLSCAPLATFQSLSVLSQLPESTSRPSGEKATELTQPECPAKVRSNAPLAASHSLRVLSQLPDSTCRSSGEKATDVITS